MTVRIYLAVAIGSALGAAARLGLALLVQGPPGTGLPLGTLAANVLGSGLIGLWAALAAPGGRLRPSPAMRQLVVGGFCGGFTTFSIFSLEVLRLAEAGRLTLAGLYVLISVLSWLAGVWLGHSLGLRLGRASRRRDL